MRINGTSYIQRGGHNSLRRISVKRLNHCAYNERSAAIIRSEQKGFVVMKNVMSAWRFIQTRFMCNFLQEKHQLKLSLSVKRNFQAAPFTREMTEAAGTLLSKS